MERAIIKGITEQDLFALPKDQLRCCLDTVLARSYLGAQSQVLLQGGIQNLSFLSGNIQRCNPHASRTSHSFESKSWPWLLFLIQSVLANRDFLRIAKRVPQRWYRERRTISCTYS